MTFSLPSPLSLLKLPIVYRPPYSHTQPCTISTFITEFANFLECVVLLNEQLLLCGDFNIHVNVSNDDDAIKFKDLLESMSLAQHVTESTQAHGNTYRLLTKREVKMAGYWPSSFFAFLWTETKSRSINTQKKNEANIQPS